MSQVTLLFQLEHPHRQFFLTDKFHTINLSFLVSIPGGGYIIDG